MIIQLIILKLFLKNKYLFLINLNHLYYLLLIILETYKHFIFYVKLIFQIILIYYYSFHLFNNNY